MTGGGDARRPVLTMACALAAMAALLGAGCSREAAVATALETSGTVERSRGGDGEWRDVAPGTTFVLGDTLRTGASSRARLELAGGGVIRVGDKARLRFQPGGVAGRGAPGVAVELGSAEVEETVAPIVVLTPGGEARLERGAHVRIHADGETSSLEVVVGRAVLLEGGREIAIEAGSGVRVHVGSAQIERFAVRVGAAVVEPAAAADEPDGGAALGPAVPTGPDPTHDQGAAAARGAGPRGTRGDAEHADITLTAGESATLHDGRPAALVRLRVAELCPDGAVVELGNRGRRSERFTGSRAIVLRLRAGAQPYRVTCADDDRDAKPRATGVLSLRRDTGDVPLARRPPVNVIDADGRRYTVLFQTRLPQLTLAWPSAPEGAPPLELHLESPAGERVIDRASPSRPLPVGTVQEGTYTFWYRAADGRISPKTTLNLRFDNAAPTAQFFRTPAPAGTDLPGAIAIDGVTVEGAKVSVAGQPLEVDGHGRFRVAAAPLEGDEAIAVRLEHPRTGIHYYVRRRNQAR